MESSPLARKLRIKAGDEVLVLGAPDGFRAMLAPLPERVILREADAAPDDQTFDVVHAFARDRAALDAVIPGAIGAVRPGGVLWISYPKISARTKTDITRDVGWDAIDAAGWKGVAQVAVDGIWSALRFRPNEEVGRSGR